MASGYVPEDGELARLWRLTEVSRAVTDAASLEDVLQLTVERAAEILEATRAALFVANEQGALEIRAAVGIDEPARERFRAQLHETSLDGLEGLFGQGLPSFLAVPLVFAGQVAGILAVGRVAGHLPPDENERLLSALADQAAVALERARLNDAARVREQLMGIVGHDLKNPLTAILMASHTLLRSKSLADPHAHLVRRIANSASRMSDIIARLLDFTLSRLGGGIPIEPEPLTAEEFCRQAMDELSLAHPQAELRLDVHSHATGCWDRARLAQVMSNLIGNAVQHGRADRPIVVRVRDDGPDCFVEVHNEGVPIPPHLLPHIFEPFRHGSNASNGSGSGPNPAVGGSMLSVGLGLYIARQIALAHGGAIGVVSNDDDGTTFTLRLPLLADAAATPRSA